MELTLGLPQPQAEQRKVGRQEDSSTRIQACLTNIEFSVFMINGNNLHLHKVMASKCFHNASPFDPALSAWRLESGPFSVNEMGSLQEVFISNGIWKSFAQNN